MKKLFIIFILLVTFIIFANDNNDYCAKSNFKI